MKIKESKLKNIFARAKPFKKRSARSFFLGDDSDLTCAGYTRLSDCPEIRTAVDTIARLVGTMTIHLMRNTESGDIRIVNQFSRKIDINPNPHMTRSNFVRWIVRTLYLEGRGNAVVLPITRDGYIAELLPAPPSLVSFVPKGFYDYETIISGKSYNPNEVLHFALNPDSIYSWKGDGYQITLHDVADNLKQAAHTAKGFMKSKYKPSLIIKVDALAEEFSSPRGRKRLLEEYVDTAEVGEPWIIPAEQFEVQQVKPLTLSDLALADFVKLDKQTVAAMLGIPSFVLGVGDFKRDEWNSFINSTIMPLAKNLEQELTRKLLYSPDLYFRFNPRSLYSYDISELSAVADDQYIRGIMTGNEVRDWLGLSPRDGLNDLVILENYIPRGMIAEQSKLTGGDEEQ